MSSTSLATSAFTTADPRGPKLTVATTEQLRRLLNDPQSRTAFTSSDTKRLWLADLGDDLLHTGCWSAPKWPGVYAQDAASEQDQLKVWLDLFVLLVDHRTTPLEELAIHSSVVLHWLKADFLWAADEHPDVAEPKLASPLSRDGWIRANAPRLNAHLVRTWGNVIYDNVIDFMLETRTIAIHGCKHSFESRNFGRLLGNLSPVCQSAQLVARGDVEIDHLRFWLKRLAWAQRARFLHADGRMPYRLIQLFLPPSLVKDHGEWIEDIWNNKFSPQYTLGGILQVTAYDDPLPSLSQMDHDRWTFGACDVTKERLGTSNDPCLCNTPPRIPGRVGPRFNSGWNAHNLEAEDLYCHSPLRGGNEDDELFIADEGDVELEGEVALELLVFDAFDHYLSQYERDLRKRMEKQAALRKRRKEECSANDEVQTGNVQRQN